MHFLSKINPLTALTSLSKIPDTISAKMLTGEQIVENEISAPIIPQKPIKIRKLKEKIKLDDRDIEQLKTDDVQISEKIKQTRRRTRKPTTMTKSRICSICNKQNFNHTFKQSNECKRKMAELKKLNKN